MRFRSSGHISTEDWLHTRREIMGLIIEVGSFRNHTTVEDQISNLRMLEIEKTRAHRLCKRATITEEEP